MPWWVSIIIGFVFIGVGACTWLNTHTIEKKYETVRTNLVDVNGNIVHWDVNADIFTKYKLVEKNNH